MIEGYYNTEFTVYRMEDETGEDGTWSQGMSEAGSFYGHRQRIVAELSENLGISFTKGFTIWCGVDEDVFEGDILKDEDGKYYSVKAINKRDYGKNQHLEVIAEQDQEYASIEESS